ncbi:hypothetical protein PENTCL1PPCAC_23541, partial [Pristionchus entomophagus]
KRINGFPWQIKVYRRDKICFDLVREVEISSTPCLAVLLECNMFLESDHWLIEAVEGKVKLISHIDNVFSLSKNFSKYSLNEDSTIEEVFSYELDKLTEDEGLIVDGSVEIEVMINVKGRSGDRY